MKTTFTIFITILFFNLCGCMGLGRPTVDQINNADYGKSPQDYKEIVTNFVKQSTLDPEKVVFSNWQGPYKGFNYILNGAWYGYKVCAQVNPMNEMGGHAGKRLYSFLIKNDIVIGYDGGYKNGLLQDQILQDACNHLADLHYRGSNSGYITNDSMGVEDGPRPF
jgi:hypothetical protein